MVGCRNALVVMFGVGCAMFVVIVCRRWYWGSLMMSHVVVAVVNDTGGPCGHPPSLPLPFIPPIPRISLSSVSLWQHNNLNKPPRTGLDVTYL